MSPETPVDANRTRQAWAQARAALGGAVVSAAAVALVPAQAVAQVAAAPALQHGGTVSGNHNASGWFTSDPHSGSAHGQAFGALADGVKLYGESSLARERYMFNTLTTHPDFGYPYYSSTSTGLAMAWWGTATGLRADRYDANSGDLIEAGDALALHYAFSVTGPEGTQWRLNAGFADDLDLDSHAGLLQAHLFESRSIDGYLSSDGQASFSGELSTNALWELPQGGPVYWVITLTADLPHDPSTGLRLYVPSDSIDAGINTIPTVSPVPEPGQWALWLAGLALLGGLARRPRAGGRARP